jgi:NAD(P)-dependent dehydrogenase (short-subunit alcohol dehydrogenase family)
MAAGDPGADLVLSVPDHEPWIMGQPSSAPRYERSWLAYVPMETGICDGRVVIVTGGGRGIGREHALLLADQGASVVVNDVGAGIDGTGADPGPAQQVVDEISDRHGGGRAVADTSDVADFAAAEQLIASAVDTFGHLDVVVNNAGILRDRMLLNMTEEEWDSVLRVHLKGTFTTSRFAARHWRDRTKAGEKVDGRIINTSSPSGLYGNVKQANYAAAKAGIAALTLVASMELARHGVTVNAVAPTALTRMTDSPLLLGGTTGEHRASLAARHVAPIVCWLASPLSGAVTGRVFDVSGQMLSVSEGWHRGPSITDPDEDPAVLGPRILELVARARRNAELSGFDGPP